VDVLTEYFLSGKLRMPPDEFLRLLQEKYSTSSSNYYVMTCHRRENVENSEALKRIVELAASIDGPVLFPAGYRTQKMLALHQISLPENIRAVDPVGYLELLELLVHSKGVLTDSGTVVEEACVLGVPSIQMRTATERPEVYISLASIKFDPHATNSIENTLEKFYSIQSTNWKHLFGDGTASYKIAKDLISCFNQQEFSGHDPELRSKFSVRSFM
jgi:UDP-N-acetylglucosamine 2-epimerase